MKILLLIQTNPFGGDWVAAAGFGAAGAALGTPPTPAIDPITGLPQDPATGTPTDGTLVTWNGATTLSRSTGAPGATPPAAGATTPMYTPNGDGTYTGPDGGTYVVTQQRMHQYYNIIKCLYYNMNETSPFEFKGACFTSLIFS